MAEDLTETIVFEGQVSAATGRPFVKMTCALRGGEHVVFSTKLSTDICTALGLRAIQASIEAERDAGFVKFVLEDLLKDHPEEDRKQTAAVMLDGLRRFREQFDADAGTMRPLSGDDPSEATGG